MGQQLVHGPAPGPLYLIDGLGLGAAALRLALVKLLDILILQEFCRLFCGNSGLGPGGGLAFTLFGLCPFWFFLDGFHGGLQKRVSKCVSS